VSALHRGYLTGPLLGALWMVVLSVTVTVAMSFATGLPFRPVIWLSLIWGAGLGLMALYRPVGPRGWWIGAAVILAGTFAGVGPMAIDAPAVHTLIAGAILGLAFAYTMLRIVGTCRTATSHAARVRGGGPAVPDRLWLHLLRRDRADPLLRHGDDEPEEPVGADPEPARLLHRPQPGVGLFRSYRGDLIDFNFGAYLWTSFYVSLLTVIITLLFSIPGAYAIARLRFRGQAALGRSILLIYMVPMIVLALPIYIAFSMTGLRNTILGIVLIYPVTTIPVALYMLQGYFRGLPAEVEEAGPDGRAEPVAGDLEDHAAALAAGAGLGRALRLHDRVERVPARLHAARRSVEVHADARVASLNSSEIPRQHLMAGSVIATVPIMVIFLGLERFMTRGMTAGSVKG
jgi:multiple sugar transport system permease protein